MAIQNTRARVAVATAIFVLVVLLLILYQTAGLARHTCEVCMDFNGRRQCRTAAGTSPEEAQRTATDNACAFLASGMTDSLRCASTPPASVKCQ